MQKRLKGQITLKLKAGVVAQYRGKVLLIRELNNRTGLYRWNIIKGTFEPDRDKDIQATALREAREEAKASIVLRYLLGVYYLRDGDDALTMVTFVADLRSPRVGVRAKKEQAIFRAGEDILETRFFSRAELRRLRPADFVGLRGYLAVQDYLKGTRAPLTLLKTLPRKK